MHKLSGEERKQSIIDSAKPLFAAYGKNGASVRDIARAAGVSEALLYKHFDSKEALYQEVLSYADRISSAVLARIEEPEPGARALAGFVHILFRLILFPVPGMGERQKTHERLLFHSLLEDGDYSRKVFARLFATADGLMRQCYEAARQSGELRETGIASANLFWFTHHLAMALNLCHLNDEPAYPQPLPLGQVAREATIFCLRGIGMTEEAIAKHADPAALDAWVAEYVFSEEDVD